MNLAALSVHKSWAMRAAFLLVVTALADCAVVWFARRPILWAVLIPSTLSLSMVAFVAIPLIGKQNR